MRIRTFQGRTIEDVLPEIRRELGPDAVVIGQRQKVVGGVGGFFGKRVTEVTAADRMPSDEQLVDLEQQLQEDGEEQERDGAAAREPQLAAATGSSAGSGMSMGRRGGLDVTDTWDPAEDAELAAEYGRVLEGARGAREYENGAVGDADEARGRVLAPGQESGFQGFDVEQFRAAMARERGEDVAAPAADELSAQARQLADQAHEEVARRTERVDGLHAYERPAPMPAAQPPAQTTFSARVDSDERLPAPAAQERSQDSAGDMADKVGAAEAAIEALRGDLEGTGSGGGTPPVAEALAEALAAAVDVIDLRAMAAMRTAMHQQHAGPASGTGAPRGSARQLPDLPADVLDDVDRLRTRMEGAGVDSDVADELLETLMCHRHPLEPERPLGEVLRDVVEESVHVRTGFPRLARAWRIAAVGPAGAGKSSFLAKLARTYNDAGMRVGVISLVVQGQDASITPDRALEGVDVRYAAGPAQASQAAEAFVDHDLVLVDTPGATYLDDDAFDAVTEALAAIGVDDVHVVVPMTTSPREARSIGEAYQPMGASRMVVSRADESRYGGQLLNLGFRLGLPMTYVTSSPNPGEGLRPASARAIAGAALDARTTTHDERNEST